MISCKFINCPNIIKNLKYFILQDRSKILFISNIISIYFNFFIGIRLNLNCK